jgi:4-amino-4-deoxy-L-arabinose transferase-like glycosyltransferase
MTTIVDRPAGHTPISRADAGHPGTAPPGLNRRQRILRGRPEDPTWARPAFFGLLLATAVLYLWGLSASGWANSFYSAAAQAGSESWKAFFFGSSDAANSITVDKPPASLWFMAISVRILGLSSFAILLPQALMGVGTVGVVYAAVRRRFSAEAGLLAGAVLALTPVATLMFRFNNPDALLMLVLTAAAYAVLRAIEDGRIRWLLLAGALVGLGFLTKQLQAVLVLPTFGGAYLVAGPKTAGKRILGLLAAFAAMIVTAGWWIAIVELMPAQYRLLVTGLIFSFMQGIFHAYYTVALAPAIAALIGIGVTTLWQQRNNAAMLVLAGTVVVTALWSYTLLSRSESWHPWIKYTVLITGLIGAAGLAFGDRLDRRFLAVIAATAVFSGLAGPAAYSISTAATPHTGSIVSAGPAVSGATGGPGGGRGGGFGGGGFGGGQPPQQQGQAPTGQTGQTRGFGGGGTGGGGMGGLLNSTTPSAELVAALQADASAYTWAAAAVGSNNASGYQLASQLPVMAIGGFNGSDPSPTLAQFQTHVAAGEIHYFIGGSGLGGASSTGGSNVGSQISDWVAANFTATTIGGTTVYDLSSAGTATATT